MSTNKSANYLRASLHRAMQQGDKSLTVSALDLKDALAELESLQTHQDITRPTAPLVGWADPVKIEQMRQGQIGHLAVSRKKSETLTHQVCAIATSPQVNMGRAESISEGETA